MLWKDLNIILLIIKSNPKSFYKFVNSKRCSTGYSNLLKYISMVANDTSISNTFADFFSNTYSSMSYDTGTYYPYATNQSCAIPFALIIIDTVFSNLT